MTDAGLSFRLGARLDDGQGAGDQAMHRPALVIGYNERAPELHGAN